MGDEEKFAEILRKLEEINHAFPDGVEAHRQAHQAMISAAQAEERFWTELKLEIAKKGAMGLLSMVVGLVLLGVAAKFGLVLGGKL